MERNLSWNRPQVTIKGQIINHNEKTWYVKRNGFRSAAGHAWGWIEGPTPEVAWTDDNDTFMESDAEAAVQQHNDWLAAQVPHDLQVIRAMQQVDKRANDLHRLEQLCKDAAVYLSKAEDAFTAANIDRAAQHDQAIVAALMSAAQSIVVHVDIPSGAARRAAQHIENIALDYGARTHE